MPVPEKEIESWLRDLNLPHIQAGSEWAFAVPGPRLLPGQISNQESFLGVCLLARKGPVDAEPLRRAVCSHGKVPLVKFSLDGAGNLLCAVSIFAETATRKAFQAVLMRLVAMVLWFESGAPLAP